jgi:peptidoglycan/xylan/chitin deacetylase (PgdA/CDA1 family)
MPDKAPVEKLYRVPTSGKYGTLATIILLFLLLWLISDTSADAPKGKTTTARHRPTFPSHPIRLAAGDDGPFFSLKDLATYTPVPRTKPPRWEIRPPLWKEYPPEIDQVPLVSRDYSAETIAYLAEHEVHYGDPHQPYVALTFDCETGSGSTLKILDTLRDQDVKATFFVLGRYAYTFPEIVQQIDGDGHEIGNHSFFHPLFTAISPVSATQEITATEAVIDWATGHHVSMRYFRFPYGGRNNATRAHAAALGYQSAFWDIDPRGWEPGRTAQDVVEHVRRTAHCGGIVIMHCGSWNDANALADVIQAIRERGMVPGTLTSVLKAQDRDVPDYPRHGP